MGTPTWKGYYHRASNAMESRNAVMEGGRFGRLAVQGALPVALFLGKTCHLSELHSVNSTSQAAVGRKQSIATKPPRY